MSHVDIMRKYDELAANWEILGSFQDSSLYLKLKTMAFNRYNQKAMSAMWWLQAPNQM
jgi:hypothetical protein